MQVGFFSNKLNFNHKYINKKKNLPVIAILSIPQHFKEVNQSKWSYIAESYVSYVERENAHVIPLQLDASNEKI